MMRAGIVECGNIAKVHAAALLDTGNVELTSFADICPERAREYAAFGGRQAHWYGSLEEMLQREELDVIHVCTPHFLHVPMALMILKAGAHVFLEKPPAISREQFAALQEAEAKYGKRIGVCFQNRYNDTTLKAEELLSGDRLGSIIGARAFVTWSRGASYYQDSGWRGSWSTEGGSALMNQSIHTLDLLTRFLGQPCQAEASMHNHHLKQVIETEDTMEAYIQFAHASASFYATNAYAVNAPVMLEIACEKGRLRIEENRLEYYDLSGHREEYTFAAKPAAGKSYWGNSHIRCIQDYYASIQDGTDYKNDLKSTETIFSLVMDLYDAARENRTVMCKRR